MKGTALVTMLSLAATVSLVACRGGEETEQPPTPPPVESPTMQSPPMETPMESPMESPMSPPSP